MFRVLLRSIPVTRNQLDDPRLRRGSSHSGSLELRGAQ